MSEWWTYRLSDLLMFAPETYYRLLELYNRDIWPAHLAATAAALGIMILSLRGRSVRNGQVIAAVLTLAWLWIGWAFHFQRYATINWAAKWFAAGFFVQAAFLAWQGIIRNRLHDERVRIAAQRAGLGIFLFAVMLQPLLGLMAGRPWSRVELFAVAPDPTAVATLGIVIFASPRLNLTLLIIPVLWCLISAATLWTMKSPEALVLAIMVPLTMALVVWKRRTMPGR